MQKQIIIPIRELLKDQNAESIIIFIKWLIKSGQNTVFTGSAGTGTAIYLASCIEFSKHCISIKNQSEYVSCVNHKDIEDIFNNFKNTHTDLHEYDVFLLDNYDEYSIPYIILNNEYRTLHFRHFRKTTEQLIDGISENMLEHNFAKSKEEAMKLTVDNIPYELHIERNPKTGGRILKRITEIIPTNDERGKNTYMFQNIFEWHDGEYRFINMPKSHKLTKNLTQSELAEYNKDINYIKRKSKRMRLKKILTLSFLRH